MFLYPNMEVFTRGVRSRGGCEWVEANCFFVAYWSKNSLFCHKRARGEIEGRDYCLGKKSKSKLLNKLHFLSSAKHSQTHALKPASRAILIPRPAVLSDFAFSLSCRGD